MYRCATLLLFAAVLSASAHAQFRRVFPQTALRGQVAFVDGSHVVLNKEKLVRELAPGGRIYKEGETTSTPASDLVNRQLCTGKQPCTVNFTLEPNGNLHDVWILTVAEAKNPWPHTPAEAATKTFDAGSQTWSDKRN